MSNFLSDHSKAVPLLQFFCLRKWFHMWRLFRHSLRKQAFSNILKMLPQNNENFQIKNSDIFHISAQNIDCEYSLEPPR